MIEGEKSFDITIRWPERLRQDETAILDIPVDVMSHQVTASVKPSVGSTPVSGGSESVASTGFANSLPSLTGSKAAALFHARNRDNPSRAHRRSRNAAGPRSRRSTRPPTAILSGRVRP